MPVHKKFLPYDSSSLANFKGWAKALGDCLVTDLGWIRSSDLGQVDWTNIPTVPDITPTLTASQSFRGAWSGSSVSYIGSASNNTACDVVTIGFATYICISSHTSSGGNAPPNLTYWKQIAYEVFEMQDTLQSTCPIFVRFQYYPGSGTPPNARLAVGVSSGSDGNGNLVGNIAFQASNPTYAELVVGYPAGLGSGGVECDIAGDLGWLSMFLWRDSRSSVATAVLIIDRARDRTGAATDAYFSVLTGGNTLRYQTLFKGGGGTGVDGTTWPSIASQFAGLAAQGGVPALPIFPLPGACANPMLGGICMKQNDVQEGGLVDVIIEGTTHTFLMSKLGGMDSILPSNNNAVGIRWE